MPRRPKPRPNGTMPMEFFRLVVNEYLSDPDVRLLTLEQRGLLVEVWCHLARGYHVRVDAPSLRAVIAPQLSQEAFDVLWFGVGPTGGVHQFFSADEDDPTKLVSRRLERERARMIEISDARSKAASARS